MYLQTWERDSSWLYCIDFLREEDHPYSKRYRYAVKWSVPTRRKPIPRATASVYFTLEVSKFKPKVSPLLDTQENEILPLDSHGCPAIQ